MKVITEEEGEYLNRQPLDTPFEFRGCLLIKVEDIKCKNCFLNLNYRGICLDQDKRFNCTWGMGCHIRLVSDILGE